MNKKQYQIQKHINPEIQIGDMVRLIDGSGLTHSSNVQDVYIILGYPQLVGSNLPLNVLDFKVVNTGITDLACGGVYDKVYLQDIEIEYEGSIFYTCSKFVSRL
jgi:hypothetical protein